MPLIRVKKGGQTCYKFGPGGKTYCGPGSRAKAARQGRAISIGKARAAGHRIPMPMGQGRGR